MEVYGNSFNDGGQGGAVVIAVTAGPVLAWNNTATSTGAFYQIVNYRRDNSQGPLAPPNGWGICGTANGGDELGPEQQRLDGVRMPGPTGTWARRSVVRRFSQRHEHRHRGCTSSQKNCAWPRQALKSPCTNGSISYPHCPDGYSRYDAYDVLQA